jgi:hypothetical protein
MRRVFLAAAFAVVLAIPATAFGGGSAPPPKSQSAPYAPPPTGTLSVCNATGAQPVTGTFTYTLAAPASAGGTLTFNIAVGTCSAKVFYPQGVSVIVTENVPAGDAVTAISIGGQSALTSSTPAAGAATVQIGAADSVLTFTTSGPAPVTPPRDCHVPNVLGLGLTAAKAAVVKYACKVGVVSRAYSGMFRTGRVMRESPGRGTVLAHNAPVDLVVSRGPRP